MVMVLTDTTGAGIHPYVAELAGGTTRVAVVLPSLPAEVEAHCRRYAGAIARALDGVDIAVPDEDLRRTQARTPRQGRRP